MKIQDLIKSISIASQNRNKATCRGLHQNILQLKPGSKLWYLDDREDKGKMFPNPNIGYGSRLLKYVSGKIKEFYQIGLSGSATGTSVYIIGIEDKTYLSKTYGKYLSSASVTGYCIKFKS